MDIWLQANAQEHIQPFMATACRFVESQEQIATLTLVQDVYQQGILEELLETTKNSLSSEFDSLHYLLKTPFRYPPLRHGSRFGTSFEQGIFYASLNTETALAETAYYRFVYMLGPQTPYPGIISSEYTQFSVSVKTQQGVLLDESAFATHQALITSPSSYEATQQLGSRMRQEGIEIARYISARDQNKGKNIALFSPKVFIRKKPQSLVQWLCQTSIKEVGLFSHEKTRRYLFAQQDFWVHGTFPMPAV